MRAPVVLGPILGVATLTALGYAPPTLGKTAAVLPVEAPTLLPSARRDVDRALRASLDTAGVTALTEEATRAHLDSAYDAGLRCPFTDPDCLRRLGLVAEADTVVVAFVDEVEARFLLRVQLIDTATQAPPQKIAAEIKLPSVDKGASLEEVVVALVRGRGATHPRVLPYRLQVTPAGSRVIVDGSVATASSVFWLKPGEHSVRVEAAGHVPVERTFTVNGDGDGNTLALALQPVAVEVNVPLLAGTATAIVGIVGVAVGAGIGAAVESDLGKGDLASPAFEERQAVGQVGVVAAIACGAIAVGGAALAIVGAMP